jgi:hypothetical protein
VAIADSSGVSGGASPGSPAVLRVGDRSGNATPAGSSLLSPALSIDIGARMPGEQPDIRMQDDVLMLLC